MSDAPLHVHVLFESSTGGDPHGCGEIRLLRPLSHPSLKSILTLTSGLELPDSSPDVVIVERLWDHSCDILKTKTLLADLKKRNVQVIFEMDDDLLSLGTDFGGRDWPTVRERMWIRWMLRSADGVIVSTSNLATRLSSFNSNIEVVLNSLDDRLFSKCREYKACSSHGQKVTFGYMGTITHIDDLFSIISPLRRTLFKHKEKVNFEVVGIGENSMLKEAFHNLPIKLVNVPKPSVLYSNFAGWMQEHLSWDFGIAPLVASQFTDSKSDIKFLDYAVQGIPSIFSKVPAYENTVRHMENGLLASSSEDWESALEMMITDESLRLKIAREAHNEVWSSRMLESMADQWNNSIRRIISKDQSQQNQ